jgi:hypothetical protein
MNGDTQQLINKSFLSNEDKQVLLKILKDEGETENFFRKFSDLIMAELKRKSEYGHALMEKLNGEFTKIEDEILKERETLGDWLKKQLAGVESIDFAASGKILDEYYGKVSGLYKKQNEQSKIFFSRFLMDET